MSSRGQMANNHAEKWGETGWKVGGRGAMAYSIRCHTIDTQTKRPRSAITTMAITRKQTNCPGIP